MVTSLRAALAAVVLGVPGSAAFAATLTFDRDYQGLTYVEAGMTISAQPGTSYVYTDVEHWSNVLGRPEGGYNLSPGVIHWTLTTGGHFDLRSIDAVHVDGYEDPVTFSGYRQGGLVATHTFEDAHEDFRFDGFVDLDSVVISMNGYGPRDPVFDNLVYSDAVRGDVPLASTPLPGSLPLLAAALAGLGAALGRGRRALRSRQVPS